MKSGDRIAQLILEKIETPTVKEAEELLDTKRGTDGFGSTGISDEEKRKSSRVSILQRVDQKPRIKNTNTCRIQRQFISIKKMQKSMK